MLRYILPALALSLMLPAVQAASLKEMELTQTLEQVARQSSEGTPRAINEDILDQGYTVEGHTLINHLSVREAHAAKMRGNPDTVRTQLAASVCRIRAIAASSLRAHNCAISSASTEVIAR